MTRPFIKVQLAPLTPRLRLRQWVSLYGVSRLARSLMTDRRTVHSWTQSKDAAMPSLMTVRKMIALSTVEPLTDGPLIYDDFFGVVLVASTTSHAYGRTTPQAMIAKRTPLTRGEA